jgi:3-methyladenine DNA glycosylase AlkD
MAARSRKVAAKPAAKATSAKSVRPSAKAVLAHLKTLGTPSHVEGLARYGIVTKKALGIPVGVLQAEAKRLGRDHDLALELWKSGWYEARLLAAFVGEPERVTLAQMNAWAKDFDNWGVCDTVCMHQFDRSKLAYGRIDAWAKRPEEFVRRAGFALLASLALHDKQAADERFFAQFELIEQAAADERNFVKKAVSWALRAIGHRNLASNAHAVALARKLADDSDATRRWVGRDVLRDLTRPALVAKLRRRG